MILLIYIIIVRTDYVIVSIQNINYNNTVSLSVTQAMSDYCSKQDIDPEEPICARVTLTGKVRLHTECRW